MGSIVEVKEGRSDLKPRGERFQTAEGSVFSKGYAFSARMRKDHIPNATWQDSANILTMWYLRM
jgi:hypothetical protein